MSLVSLTQAPSIFTRTQNALWLEHPLTTYYDDLESGLKEVLKDVKRVRTFEDFEAALLGRNFTVYNPDRHEEPAQSFTLTIIASFPEPTEERGAGTAYQSAMSVNQIVKSIFSKISSPRSSTADLSQYWIYLGAASGIDDDVQGLYFNWVVPIFDGGIFLRAFKGVVL